MGWEEGGDEGGLQRTCLMTLEQYVELYAICRVVGSVQQTVRPVQKNFPDPEEDHLRKQTNN